MIAGFPKYQFYIHLLIISALLSSNCLHSQEKNPLLFYNSEKVQIQGYVQTGVNLVAETNLFWNLADVPELDYEMLLMKEIQVVLPWKKLMLV